LTRGHKKNAHHDGGQGGDCTTGHTAVWDSSNAQRLLPYPPRRTGQAVLVVITNNVSAHDPHHYVKL